MTRTSIVPAARAAEVARYEYSPGVLDGDTLYVSGQVGTDEHDRPLDDPEAQYVACFDSIREIAGLAGLGMTDVVEIVSYHTDFEHLDLFVAVKGRYFSGPNFPAWTSVAVAGLAQPGAIVEVQAKAIRTR
jgi:enamine deaminase RidA (YjgF/YER057c/UK114 family)